MTAETKLLKVAVIRKEGYPVGQPAPCYLNCPCGARPDAKTDKYRVIYCSCGRVYDNAGHKLFGGHA